MYQEQGEALIGNVVFGQLIDVVVFATGVQSDRVVVERFRVGWVHPS